MTRADSGIGPEGAKEIAESLPYSSIRELNLNGTAWTSPEQSYSVCVACTDSTGNKIGPEGAIAFAEALPSSYSLHTLRIESTRELLFPPCLCLCICVLESILAISSNTHEAIECSIGSIGTKAIAACLPYTKVFTLDLRGAR